MTIIRSLHLPTDWYRNLFFINNIAVIHHLARAIDLLQIVRIAWNGELRRNSSSEILNFFIPEVACFLCKIHTGCVRSTLGTTLVIVEGCARITPSR